MIPKSPYEWISSQRFLTTNDILKEVLSRTFLGDQARSKLQENHNYYSSLEDKEGSFNSFQSLWKGFKTCSIAYYIALNTNAS
jgi:hypothetical protein